jgi:hypothetical protein
MADGGAFKLANRDRDRVIESQLRANRTSYESHYRELDEYIRPGRVRFQTSDANRGQKNMSRIINSTGTIAHRNARSGLHSGMTSPARPWCQLTTPDPELADYGPVKAWLYTCTQRINSIFLRSNLYNSLPTLYGDQLQFGIGAMLIDELEAKTDKKGELIRTYTYRPGSYWIALDDQLRLNTWMREYSMTVQQLVTKFGDSKAGPDSRWQNFSRTVQNLWDKGDFEATVEVMHTVHPNHAWDDAYYEAKYKAFRSCSYEKGSSEQRDGEPVYLLESGYDEFPIVAPRWDVAGEDVYGRGPGMDALPDIKALQTYEKKKARALEKMIDPALTGPAKLANTKVSLMAGDVTAVDAREGQQGLRPIHETKVNLSDITNDIREHERRIKSAFYEDLFLMIDQMEGVQPRNQLEMMERKEEKMIMLGPVLERENDELFDPLVYRVFKIMERKGLLPPRPPEMAGQMPRIEYTSVMQQAQKLIGASGVERFAAFVGNMAGVDPGVLDKWNRDETVDVYGEMYGVPPNLVVPTDQAMEARAQKAQQAAAQQAAERAQMLSQGAKNLAAADISSPNALTALMGQA